eukprot:gene37830-24524_t
MSQEAWMGANWGQIRDRTLVQLTLPGSHNSANTHALNAGRICASDYQYQNYRAQTNDTRMTEAEFNAAFIPWNVNHDEDITGQLRSGIRWFHLKVCAFETGTSPFNLSN